MAATGEQLLGVVSAQVVIDDEAGLDALSASDDVWLVDLAVEHHGRSNPGARDVVMNDLFWMNAGWTE